MKVRCLECYKQRPGGRCHFCPLNKKNRHLYQAIGDGWFVLHEPQKKSNIQAKKTHKNENNCSKD